MEVRCVNNGAGSMQCRDVLRRITRFGEYLEVVRAGQGSLPPNSPGCGREFYRNRQAPIAAAFRMFGDRKVLE